ncbi:MAG: ABC transporter permease [Chloroflexota bacterium]
MTANAKATPQGKIAKIEQEAYKGKSLWADAFERLLRNRAAVAGAIIIIVNLLVATFAPLVAPQDFATQVLEDNNAAPQWVINLFPVMRAADQRMTVTAADGWEVQIENGQSVSIGDLLAVNNDTGDDLNAIMDGTAYIDGNTVGVTRANIVFYEFDDSYDLLLDSFALMNAVDAGTDIATNGTETITTGFRGLVSIDEANGTIQIKEQNGGYVQVSNDYPLGADSLGRDMLSRIIYGARISLSVAFIGPMVSLIVGLSVGLLSGYVGGSVDNMLMRFVDIMYAFPTILLIILLMAVFRSSFADAAPGSFRATVGSWDAALGGMLFIFIGIGLTSWMNLARLTRGQVLSVRKKEYIEAAHAIGTDPVTIIRTHVLPNILGPIVVAETLTIPVYISYEAFLSFIGLGVNPPTPSWGAMIADGAEAIRTYPSQALFPALALFFIMFAFNFLGDGLRDALDPRMRGVE